MTENTLHLKLVTDQNLIPMEVPSQRVLEINVQAPTGAVRSSRPLINLALVLDRSGSMSGGKLEYVKLAAAHVLDLLQEQDRVAIVAFDNEVNLISPSLPCTTNNRRGLKSRVSQLTPGGNTNLSAGWLTGCQEVAAAAQEGTLNRALLLTDGEANAGIIDLEMLAQQARELARRGVSTSTFGVGQGFNEHLLEAMSNQGGGNFYYIETPTEIPALFQREFKELAAVTAREVEIVLKFPAHVHLQVLGGWVTEFSEGHLRISLGNLYSSQTQELYIKVLTPPGSKDERLEFQAGISGKDETGQPLADQSELFYQYGDRAVVAASPRKRVVMEHYAVIDLAETSNEALKLERQGQNEKANQLLNQSIRENLPFVQPLAAQKYEQMSERMKSGMDETDRKQSHYASYNQKRQRPQ